MARKKVSLGDAMSDMESFAKQAPLKRVTEQTSTEDNKSVVITLTVKKKDLQQIDEYCKSLGVSRSSFIRMAALEKTKM